MIACGDRDEVSEVVVERGQVEGSLRRWGFWKVDPWGCGEREEWVADVREESVGLIGDRSPSSDVSAAGRVPRSEEFEKTGCLLIVGVK
mgnify:CR=1 FL=1